jgi:hypothetical protein
MNREQMEEIVETLVMGFDCAKGNSEMIYLGVWDLIYQTMGVESSKKFGDFVDACDGSFFIGIGTGEAVWEEIKAGAVWAI